MSPVRNSPVDHRGAAVDHVADDQRERDQRDNECAHDRDRGDGRFDLAQAAARAAAQVGDVGDCGHRGRQSELAVGPGDQRPGDHADDERDDEQEHSEADRARIGGCPVASPNWFTITDAIESPGLKSSAVILFGRLPISEDHRDRLADRPAESDQDGRGDAAPTRAGAPRRGSSPSGSRPARARPPSERPVSSRTPRG